ncbi:COG0705 Membrane associated serine protease [Candidatus Nanopelagicaceae bacterium]|jgi:membrane associated rhomboid family serine protease
MKQRSSVLTIITIICAFYLYELYDSGLIGTFGLYGIDLLRSTNEWYRLVTVALVHDNTNVIPIHLAFNMLALHSLGTPIETFLGRNKFLIIFFVSLIGGSIASAMFLGYNGYSIGASGAVFGLFGAWAVISKRIGAEVKSVLVIIGLNFVLGFTIGGVDWRAHLGGLIAGYAVTQFLLSASRS